MCRRVLSLCMHVCTAHACTGEGVLIPWGWSLGCQVGARNLGLSPGSPGKADLSLFETGPKWPRLVSYS